MKYGKEEPTWLIGLGGCLVFIVIYTGLALLMGGLLAFLWNEIIVTTLELTTATLNLWTGTGLYILLSIVGGVFRSYSSKN